MNAPAAVGSVRARVLRPWLWAAGALAWMVLQYWLSDQPKLPGPGTEGSVLRDVFNYGAHLASYAVLATLFWRATGGGVRNGSRSGEKRRFLAVALLAVLYAISDEFHQRFVPGRTASVYDFAVDCLGIALGIILAMRLEGVTRYTLARWFERAAERGERPGR